MSAQRDRPTPADSRTATVQWCPRCDRGAGDADACPACQRPTVARQPDPEGVVPDGFIEAWNAASDAPVSTIADALRVAECAPTTTARADMPRCCECASTKLLWESGERKCDECGTHPDEVLPAPSAVPVRGASRDAPEPVCPDCGSWRLADGFGGELECLDCAWLGARGVDASAVVDDGQATLGEVAER